jgi:hypothetical protein
MSHRNPDDFSDDQAAKTVVLDMGGVSKLNDEEATVVLDLTPSQVNQILSNGKAPADTKPNKPGKK